MNRETTVARRADAGAHFGELARYVPNVLIRGLAANGSRPCPIAQHLEGALLLADVSGYSRLAEKVASNPSAGAEEMSVVLNEHFGALVDIVHRHQGDILKFAGDAILVFWEDDPLDGGKAVTRAAAAAFAMQKSLRSSADGMELRIGISAGPLVLLHVEVSSNHREFVVAGAAMVELASIGAAMNPREVVLTNRAWARMREVAEGVALPTGAVRLERMRNIVPSVDGEAAPPIEAAAESLLHPYIPPNVLPRILAGHSEWLAELRNVSVLFVQLPGLSQMVSPHVAQSLLASVHRGVNRYEGSISNISSDDKGISILITFGLPPIAHEDDAVRSVHTALVVEEALREQGLVGAVGMSTGPAFCGLLGNDRRLQYVVLGDVVNRAARLMTVSSSGVLCDESTATAAGEHFGFEEYPAILIKGRSTPLPVFRPFRSHRTDRVSRAPLVGRESEFRTLADHVHRIQNGGPGGILLVEGEAGIGKSRLIQDTAELGRALGLTTLHGAAESIDANTPYHAWRSVFAQLLSLNLDEEDPDRRMRSVAAALSAQPEAAEFLPLLAPLFGFRMGESRTTAEMDLDARGRRTQTLLLQLLASAITGPTLVLLEDAHWFDSASWQLARIVVRQHPDMLLVMTIRPDMKDPAPLMEGSEPSPNVVTLQLHPLSRGDVKQLIAHLAGVEQASPPIVDFVFSRAEGNPFFTEQIVLALRDAGALTPYNAEAYAGGGQTPAFTLPDSLQGVIVSRIDNLPPNSQLLLKTASVLGRYFTLDGLRAIYPLTDSRQHLDAELSLLTSRGILQRVRSEPEVTLRFQHAITHEATYGLLPVAQRRKLHRLAADWLEAQHARDMAPVYPLLVHHWRGAGDNEALMRYLDLAGDQALNSGAYKEAIAFFEEAQQLVAADAALRLPSGDRLEWAIRERRISEAFYGLGRLPESYQRLSRAIAVLDRPLPKSFAALMARTAVEALRQLAHRVRGGVPLSAHTAREPVEACLAYERLAELGYFLGQSFEILYDVLRNLNLAETANARAQAARSYAHMGAFMDLIPWHTAARHYQQLALAAADASDQTSARALVYEAIGLSSIGLGQWEKARRHLTEGAELFNRLGQRRKWEECLTMAMVPSLYHQSEHAYYERSGIEILRSALQSGDRQSERWVRYDWARLAVWRGHFADARTELARAIELLPGSIDPSDEVRFYGLETLILVRLGEMTEARAAAERALEKASTIHSLAYYTSDGFADLAEACLGLAAHAGSLVPGERKALRDGAGIAYRALQRNARLFPIAGPAAAWIAGLQQWELGRHARAARAWTKCLARAERLSMPHMQGLAHLGLGLHHSHSAELRRRHLNQARIRFSEAGCSFFSYCAERAVVGELSLPFGKADEAFI